MGRKFYTILIIPHARASFRRLRVSQAFLVFAAALVAVLAISSVLLPRYFLTAWHQSRVLSQLEDENESLRTANQQYDRDLFRLRVQLSDFESKAAKFALMAGVEDLPVDRLPSGSPGELPADYDPTPLRPGYLAEEFSIVKSRARALDASYQALEEAYSEKLVLLATTPSISPTRGIMGSGYRYRKDPFTGEREFHAGLDIVANAGTPVVTTADGVVTRAGRMGGYGKAVFVSHGNGISTRYAHLSSVQVKAGTKVKRGDLLGKVGATGRAMGFHLHYEVLAHDRKVDPLQYILDDHRIY